MTELTRLQSPPRRNRRFFSFHRPQRCRGCGAILGTGRAGECRVSRSRDAHRIHNLLSHACPQCLGFSELTSEQE